MHTAKLLAEALEVARALGYVVREEYLEGAGGGHCLFGGKKWLLLDVTQSTDEQLTDAVDALRAEPGLRRSRLTPSLAAMLQFSKAA
jgi:hypothetical protein